MTNAYTKADLRSILRSCNIEIVSETGTDFLCLCPFHHNTDSPAFAVSYSKGLYICYNQNCDSSGTILDLVKSLTNRNDFEAIRFIQSNKLTSEEALELELKEILEDKPDFVEFSQDTLKNLSNGLLNKKEAQEYLQSRKIYESAWSHFTMGYSENMGMVTVPLHAPDGLAVGIIGRSIKDKKFKNSVNLPRNKTMFNLHRAKREGGTIIVCESSFDVIRLWQAGYPNAVATLGGSISDTNIQNLNKYASTIILMIDNDQAGRSLGKTIANKLKNKNILWAYYDHGIVYPHSAKDVGDMTDEEIKQCIKNAIPHFEYAVLWYNR
jgi:DNA primase